MIRRPPRSTLFPYHDALPICAPRGLRGEAPGFDRVVDPLQRRHVDEARALADEQEPRRAEPTRERVVAALGDRLRAPRHAFAAGDRKSTRLNSSHANISYAVF